MESETALVFVTFFLLIATAYYAWNTRKLLKEQRRAVEYQIKPVIGIRHPRYPATTIEFEVSKNDALNLRATMTIDGISDTQELGSVLIDPERFTGYSKRFNLGEFLGKVPENSSTALTIRIEYQSFSGYRYCEEFDYHCVFTERGLQEIKPHEKLPISKRLIKEGY